MEQDTRDIAKGASANALGVVARTLLVAFYLILARLYGPAITGYFLLSRASIDTLSKLGILGMDRAILARGAMKHAVKDDAGFYRSVAQALTVGLISSVLLALILQGLAPVIARFVEQPELIEPLRIMSWSIPFLLISAVFLFATRALRVMRFEIYTKSVIEPLTLLILGIVFAILGYGIDGLAVAFVSMALCGAVAATWFFFRLYSFKLLGAAFFQWGDGRSLLRIAVPTGIYDFLNQLLQRVEIFLVAHFMPATTVGIFGLALEAALTLKAIRQSFDPIVIPVISAAHQLKNKLTSQLQYQNVTRWILILNLCIFGVLVLAGDAVMSAFGRDFTGGTGALILLSLGVSINAVLGVSELFLLIDRPMFNVLNTMGATGVSLALNLWLIPRLGIEGAALAMMTTYLVMNIARVIQVKHFYGIQPLTRFHARAVMAFSLSLGVMVLLKWLLNVHEILFQLLIAFGFVLLDGVVLYFFGAAPEENRLLTKVGVRLRRMIADEKVLSDNP